tara:strand:- start:38 stop:223 length:186 start_codon:yes stop_codon:yes gene_type:complete
MIEAWVDSPVSVDWPEMETAPSSRRRLCGVGFGNPGLRHIGDRFIREEATASLAALSGLWP